MNAYLFFAGATTSQQHTTRGFLTWDSCTSAIVCDGDADQAQKQFETWCQATAEGQDPVKTEIKKVVGAQSIGQLLTETGNEPLDWQQLLRQTTDPDAVHELDDFEQGYWVDVNQVFSFAKLCADIDCLDDELPEDIRSGLNWAANKQFLFVVSVLSPPPTPPDPEAEFAAEEQFDETGQPHQASAPAPLDSSIASLRELRDKKAAAVVRARNSVVAAWVWCKFAADTPLAENEIQIGPCSNIILPE